MKHLLPTLLLSCLLTSCGSESDSTSSAEEQKAPVYRYTQTSDWKFNPEKSKADWSRVLDQKATKRQVKLFGNMVDVEMGPVKMDMSGNVELVEGGLTTKDEGYEKGQIVFDMATFHFAKEKGEGLFNVKEYPHSTLDFLSFTVTSDSVKNYNSRVKLTIQEHAQEYDIPLSLTKSDSILKLKGSFKFNTLDFPLRDNIQKKDVNKDEITVKLDLGFDLAGTKKDSVRVD